jgi:antitoxin FitA
MPSIQIKDVPADVHGELRRRAALAGKSLQEFLLGWLLEEARYPSIEEVLDRAGGRSGGALPFAVAVEAIGSDRSSR